MTTLKDWKYLAEEELINEYLQQVKVVHLIG